MTTRHYFGTDGIRGKANTAPMTPDIALKLGMAAGALHRGNTQERARVVIAKDTRLSGYMLEPALTAGFVSVGMDVILVGPMPTPAVAMLVRSFRADLGVMISASHNPYDDNGIKLFGADGFKLSDAQELEIERAMEGDLEQHRAAPELLGRARRLDDAAGRYIEFAKRTFPKELRLDGLKIVIDCAHGAAYHVAPTVLWELEAEVVSIGVKPNGFNINQGCGSTDPALLQETVLKEQADLGIALDGDADRVILCDEKGQIVDGDQLMAMVATELHQRGDLKGGGLVATQMSNMGLERYLAGLGLTLARTKVGDRYVVAHMREHGFNVGGEQSGHIILSDHATTGDGLIAALQVLALLKESGSPASEVTQRFTPLPQILKNVRYEGADPLESADVQQTIRQAEQEMSGTGRIFIRKSGTEPLIRVMAEGEDASLVEALVERIVEAVEQVTRKAA